jgi:hypothetical protein
MGIGILVGRAAAAAACTLLLCQVAAAQSGDGLITDSTLVGAKASAYLPDGLAKKVAAFELARNDPVAPLLVKFYTKSEATGDGLCARQTLIRYERSGAENADLNEPLIIYNQLSYSSGCEGGGQPHFAQVSPTNANFDDAKRALQTYLTTARKISSSSSKQNASICARSEKARVCPPRAVSSPPLFEADQLKSIIWSDNGVTLGFAPAGQNFTVQVLVKLNGAAKKPFVVDKRINSPRVRTR